MPVESRVCVLLAAYLVLGGPTLATDRLILHLHQAYKSRLWADLENGVESDTDGQNATPMLFIAFATVEAGSTGARCLRFRRGDSVISSMALDTLHIELVGSSMIGLSPPGLTTPLVYVHFDSPARMAKFSALVAPTA